MINPMVSFDFMIVLSTAELGEKNDGEKDKKQNELGCVFHCDYLLPRRAFLGYGAAAPFDAAPSWPSRPSGVNRLGVGFMRSYRRVAYSLQSS